MSVHLANILEELGFAIDRPVEILCDSRGARMLAVHAQSTPRTRHIHRRWFFVTHYKHAKRVEISEVASADNWANVLTKPTGVTSFRTDRERLGVR